ncbi:hypothetical protein AAT17_05835 [Nonlabens sp. MIC269]|nr:hypothetical protein AAT17_05835 [Nonlabens sp. MIC269]
MERSKGLMPTLETERLLLRPFEISDKEFVFDLHKDPQVMQFTGKQPMTTVLEAKLLLDEILHPEKGQYASYQLGRYAVIDKSIGKKIGSAGLNYTQSKNIIEIGYKFLKEFWGQGYATESCKALLDHGFNTRNFDSIAAHIAEENIGSQIVAERLGMQIHHRFLWEGVIPGRFYTMSKSTFQANNL